MKERKRKMVMLSLVGVLSLVGLISITYAAWNKLHTQSGENSITTLKCFNITYSDEKNDISLNNAVPIKDEQGLTLTPFQVTITNTCDTNTKYNVILNKKTGSTLDNQYVRVAVDNKHQLLSETTPIEKRTISGYSVDSSYIIGSGFVTGNKSKTINIRSWLDYKTTQEQGEHKEFSYKITIETGATNEEPPLSLGEAIIANNEIKSDSNLNFRLGFPNSSTSEEDIKNKSGLYVAEDDDGDTYYFRGKIDNNYVSFAGKTWRIIRINGDGTVRIILDDNIGNNAYNSMSLDYQRVGFTYGNSKSCTKSEPCITNYENGIFTNTHGGTNSEIKGKLEEWYNTNLKDYDDKIAQTTFCNDVSYGGGTEASSKNLYYGAYKRLFDYYKPDLHCPEPIKEGGSETRDYGGVYELKIGLINGDELFYGGYSPSSSSSNAKSTDNYLRRSYSYWTMSPSYGFTYGVNVFYASNYGYISYYYVNGTYGVAPVVNLGADVTIITAKPENPGTADNPYVVE